MPDVSHVYIALGRYCISSQKFNIKNSLKTAKHFSRVTFVTYSISILAKPLEKVLQLIYYD